MNDTIKDFEGCLQEGLNHCIDCEYRKAPKFLAVCRPLAEKILEILKEQDAVMPNVSSVEQRCGNCNKVIEMDGWKACPWCGKPIDWERWWKRNG